VKLAASKLIGAERFSWTRNCTFNSKLKIKIQNQGSKFEKKDFPTEKFDINISHSPAQSFSLSTASAAQISIIAMENL
jgi:hypothetical protein